MADNSESTGANEHVFDAAFRSDSNAKSTTSNSAEVSNSDGTPVQSGQGDSIRGDSVQGDVNLFGRTISQVPVRSYEVLFLLCLILLADITIFRGTGYFGVAVFVGVAPLLLAMSSPVPTYSRILAGLFLMITATVLRLAWQGSLISSFTGAMLLIAFAMSLANRVPFILDLLRFAAEAMNDAIYSMEAYAAWGYRQYRKLPHFISLSWLLPSLVVSIFSAIFIAANPNLTTYAYEFANQILTVVSHWLEAFPISITEIGFCVAFGWYAIGLLRPAREQTSLNDANLSFETTSESASEGRESTLFDPYRHTLVAVSVLFAAYLVFEFQTLWFQKFPPGFQYPRYTHQGAAWLTVALAIATVTLCLIFRGSTLRDPRLPKLKFWTWIWSIENLILVLAVYNRLWIYIAYNGLTRLRIVGLLGVTSVLIGFLLVMSKISSNRSAKWLIQRQLVTVTLVSFCYVVSPVDWLVFSYNVRRIQAADLSPIAQITHQTLSTEALQALTPLLESSDPVIREGISSRLEEWLLAEANGPNQQPGWTSFQVSHAVLAKTLAPLGIVQDDAESKRRRTEQWLKLRLLGYQHQH